MGFLLLKMWVEKKKDVIKAEKYCPRSSVLWHKG